MGRIKTYLIIGLVALVGLTWAKGEWEKSRIRKNLQAELERVAGDLIQEKETIYSRYAVATKNLDDVLASNDSLKAMLKGRGEELRQTAQLVARYKTLYIEAQGRVSTDTTTIPDSTAQCRVDFAEKQGRLYVEGFTLCPSGLISLSIDQDPLRLDLFGVETRSGLLRWYVETNDSDLAVEDLTVHYKPKGPSFWQQHWWKLGLGVGAVTYLLLK